MAKEGCHREYDQKRMREYEEDRWRHRCRTTWTDSSWRLSSFCGWESWRKSGELRWRGEQRIAQRDLAPDQNLFWPCGAESGRDLENRRERWRQGEVAVVVVFDGIGRT